MVYFTPNLQVSVGAQSRILQEFYNTIEYPVYNCHLTVFNSIPAHTKLDCNVTSRFNPYNSNGLWKLTKQDLRDKKTRSDLSLY